MRRTWTLLPALVALLLAWPLLVQASRDHKASAGSHASSPVGQAGGSISPSPLASASAAPGSPTMSMAAPTEARTTTVAAKPRPKATKARPTITFSVVPSPVRTTPTPTAAPRTTVPPTTPSARTTTAAPHTTAPRTTPQPTVAPTTTKASPKPTHKPKPAVTTSAPPLTGGTVTMGNFQYAMPAHVAPGARIAVYNADSVGHTLTIASAGIDLVVAGNSGGYFTAPMTPGSYAITCDYHADMTATLIVR